MSQRILPLILAAMFLVPAIALAQEAPAQPMVKLPVLGAGAELHRSWISATPTLWDWAMNLIQGLPKRPIDRERAEAKGKIPVGGTEKFWVMDVAGGQPYQMEAVLRKVGAHCYIYVEKGHDMSDELVAKLTQQFDEVIYKRDTSFFGYEWKPGIDWDERVTLLFMDVVDGWEPGKGYVGGYFTPTNEASARDIYFSNEREMVVLDIYPSDPSKEDYLGVLAHEFQHLIHWNQDAAETRFLNEAQSQIAFYACGYGHAPQTFQFVKTPDTQLDEFDNGLDDYGEVYAWMYYLWIHYAGDTDEERAAFFRALNGSKLKGLESFAEALKLKGVEKPLPQIIQEFLVANYAAAPELAEGQFGYDETFSFAVADAAVHGLDAVGAPSFEDNRVSLNGADYVTVVKKQLWTPLNPCMLEPVTLLADEAGEVLWNVNDGILPPAKFIPEGSTVDEAARLVRTPLKAIEARGFELALGPFVRGGLRVDRLNFRIRTADGNETPPRVVSIFALDAYAKKNALRRGGFTFRFEGDKPGLIGTKKRFALWTIAKGADGTTVSPVAVDEKNRAELAVEWPAGQESMTFAVMGLSGKKLDYAYEFLPASAGEETAEAALDRLMTLARVRAAAEAVVGRAPETLQDRAFAAGYHGILDATQNAETDLAGRMAADAGFASKLASAMSRSGERDAAFETLRTLLRKARGQAEATLGVLETRAGSAGTRSDDADTAHSNLGYLTFKTCEAAHGLTHLKIDPMMLEGQILQTWKMLQIAKGWPNLPIPDGLAIADFDQDMVYGILKTWCADYDLDYPFAEGTAPMPAERPVPYTDDLAHVKEVMRRLTLAETVIEHVYNSGLVMAEDFAACFYDFARLVLSGYGAITDIADHFSDVPIVGPVAAKVKAIIHGRLVRVVEKIVNLVATRLKSPYNSLAPTIASFAVYIYGKIMKLEIPGENSSWVKEMGCKLAGKYALTAIPKIGYVARGQIAVEDAVKKVRTLSAEGSYESAYAAVMDDGDEATASSVVERVNLRVGEGHRIFTRNRKIADLGRKITVCLQYGALLDPTNIARVAGIVAAVATSGVIAQSGYVTGRTFFALPRGLAREASALAFEPGVKPSFPEGETMLVAKPDGEIAADQSERFAEAYRAWKLRVSETLAAARSKTLRGRTTELLDELQRLEEEMDDAAIRLEALVYGDVSAERGDDELYKASQAALLERVAAYGAILTAAADQPVKEGVLETAFAATEAYATRLGKAVDGICSLEEATPALAVSKSWVERLDGKVVVHARVSNLSRQDFARVTVTLESGLHYGLKENARRFVALPARGDVELRWTLSPSAEDEDVVFPVVAIKAERSGTKPLSRLQALPGR